VNSSAGRLQWLLSRQLPPRIVAAEAASKPKPNSVIHGVRVGVITYSYRGGNINTGEETLKALLEGGLSEVELMDGPIRSFVGIRSRGRRAWPFHQTTSRATFPRILPCAARA